MDNNRKIHEAELQVADFFVKACEENDLQYFMLGGTFLGAVRHKGFIPWDDDMDFGMPRDDYEKLFNILENSNLDGIELKSYRLGTDHDYPMKIVSNQVRLVDMSTGKRRIRNPWIDIFPLDGMPTGGLRRKIAAFRLLSIRAFLKLSQLSSNVSVNNPNRTNAEKIIIRIGSLIRIEKLLNEKKMMNLLDKNLKRYSYDSSEYVVNFMGAYKFKEMFPKSIYEDLCLYEFNNRLYWAPSNYDYVLRQMYGDYMEPPKKEERNKHSTQVL